MAIVSIAPKNVLPSALARYVGLQGQLRTVAAVDVDGGQVAYLLAAGTYGLASTTGADPVNRPVGIYVNSAGAGQPVDIVWYDPALSITGGGFVTGLVYILGLAGGINPASDAATGWKTTPVANSLSATLLCWHTPMGNLQDPMGVPGGAHA